MGSALGRWFWVAEESRLSKLVSDVPPTVSAPSDLYVPYLAIALSLPQADCDLEVVR